MAIVSRRVVPVVLFVLLLFVITEMGTERVVEARHMNCESQSHMYRGACWRERNGAHVCNTEGFPSGKCKFHGIERKCFCKKLC